MEIIQLNFTDNTGMIRLEVIKDAQNKSRKSLVFPSKVPQYIMPRQFLYPILAAFKANIYYSEHAKKIGWCVDNEQLFKKEIKNLA